MERPVFTLRHVGINPDENQDAVSAASKLSKIFDFDMKQGRTSIFAGDFFEIMRQGGPGVHGHIAIGVDSVEDAVTYMKQKGIAFDETSAKKNADGYLSAIYFEDEIGGFAIHLLRN